MLAVILLISYLIGSIPFAYLIVRVLGKKDVREYGSGNVGATNAARIMGLKGGLLVLVFDIFKGYFAVLLSQYLYNSDMAVSLELLTIMAGIAVIAGHNWSVFLKFSGGKGVATGLGVILRVIPLAAFSFMVIWLALVLLTRYVSLGSLVGAVSFPIIAFIYYSELYFVFSLIIAGFIFYRHKGNIKRLFKGEERKMKWPPRIYE